MSGTLIVPDLVFDAVKPEGLSNVSVLVEGGQISRIVKSGELVPSEARGSDCLLEEFPGCTALPGLIDGHAHLVLSAETDAIERFRREDRSGMLLLRAARNAEQALRGGVTTLRDCGGPGWLTLALRDAIVQGVIPGPTVLACGPVITTTGGHGYEFGLECDGVEDLRRAVREVRKRGGDFIKVMATGGSLPHTSNPYRAQYTVEELRAITTEAHRLGLTVAAHLHATEGIRNAVDADVDTLEHCSWLGIRGKTEYDDNLVVRIAREGRWAFLNMTSERSLITGATSEYHLRMREMLEGRLEARRRMVESGVRVAVTSDAGFPYVRFDEFALSVEVMHQFCGLSAAHAIIAATRAPAEALGLSDVGVLGPGKRADILVVEGNPLLNIEALQNVRAVFKAGSCVYRRKQGEKVGVAQGL